MPRLRAVFELAEKGFVSGVERILKSADKAGQSIENASVAADKVQTSFDKAGKSGKKAKDGFVLLLLIWHFQE